MGTALEPVSESGICPACRLSVSNLNLWLNGLPLNYTRKQNYGLMAMRFAYLASSHPYLISHYHRDLLYLNR